MAETATVFEQIQELLTSRNVEFTVSSHRPVYTSKEAAQVRGESLHSGAKALILKVDKEFAMFVLPADRRLDNRKIRKNLGYKAIRFATPEEAQELTTLSPGSIPPFGSLFRIPTYCDILLGDNEWINFNAGSHTASIRMRYQDYIMVEQPLLADFAASSQE